MTSQTEITRDSAAVPDAPSDAAGVSHDIYDGLFFPGGGRRKVVESLEHFARYGSMLLFLQSAPGGGKTTVLQQFVQEADNTTQTLFLQGKKTAHMISAIEFELGLQPTLDETKPESSIGSKDSSKVEGVEKAEEVEFQPELDIDAAMPEEDSIERIRKYCQELANRGRRLLLVIDDVDRRHHDNLGRLMELADTAASNLKLVLSGTPTAFTHVKALADVKGVLLNSIELSVFTPDEASAYAEFRSAAAGRTESPYSELQLKAAWKRSECNLNRYHQLLAEFPVPAQKERNRPLLPLPHFLVAGMLVVVIALLVSLRGEDTEEVKDVVPIVLERIEPQEPVKKAEANSSKLAQESNNESRDISVRDDLRALSDEIDETKIAIDAEPEKTAKAVLAASPKELDKPLEATEESGASVSNIAVDIKEQITKEMASETEKLAASVEEEKVKAVSSSPVSAPKVSDTSTAKEQAVHRRLLAWPDTGYALQLFGTHNRARAEKLVQDYFGQADLLFYETRHNNKDWFVVINGPYSGSESARKGIDDLPDGLRGLRPWPRNIASIKRDIRRYHRN